MKNLSQMMARIFLLSLTITLATVSAVKEQVWIRDLNADHDRRNLESAGLPSSLRFELSRESNEPELELNLEENRRLNANAPVFDVETTSDGKQRLVRKDSVPLKATKFYQDKRNGGAFQVTCENQQGGACQRKLYGNFNISGRSYELKPVPDAPTVPSLHGKRNRNSGDVPHVLVPSAEDEDRPRLQTGDANKADFLEIPDNNLQDRKEFLEELKSFLSKKQKDIIAKKLRTSRRRRATNLYAMEIVVAADPAMWNKYYETTSASGGLNRNDATELRLKQHFAHLINGVSLRYESIEDPEMDIYVTFSGYIFYKTIDSTNPLPPTTQIQTVNGIQYADADTYINSLTSWASNLQNLPHNDHIAVFTGYELYSGSTSNDGVAGKAWVKGVCNSYRTSINEDGSYFVTVSVAAHEIGHNLGSNHDGSGTSTGCGSNDKYLMAPMVTSFYPGQDYTVNPWRFSQCSIDAFKSYINSMGSSNCLLDHGDYYDEGEYSSHVSLLPGQLHTPDEQCKLVRGDGSGLCSNAESEDICTTMLCKGDDGNCWYYAAARGTPCGPSSQNKWCIEGQCVTRSDSHTDGGNYGGGSSNTGGTQVVTTTENTNQAGAGNTGCVDHGWEDWSCQTVSDYFLSTYGATPSQWCTDPTWNYNCCAFCSGGSQVEVATTTTTTTTEAPTTTSGDDGCVDIGWSCASGPWTCQMVSDYFLSTYGYQPSSWCRDPNWKYRCCQYCAGYGI